MLADLDAGVPAEIDGSYDVVVRADVLEHVRRPARYFITPTLLSGHRVGVHATRPVSRS